MIIPIIGQSYNVESRSFDASRTINMYPVVSETGSSKSPNALRKTPGLRLAATAEGGPIRGSISSTSERAFVVSAQFFVEFIDDNDVITHGELDTQSGLVSIAENNLQVMVVDGDAGWIFTKADNSWQQITDPSFPANPSYVTYQDGYFIVSVAGTQTFFISALGDGLVWDGLDFTSVESSPDNLVSVFSDNGNLWCLGNRSVEAYQNTGNADFPFERIPGAIVQTGCAAPFTVQKFDTSIAWLGTDEQGQGIVWVAQGYNVIRISTSAIERRIAEAGDFSEAYAYVYHEQGHIFYCLQIQGLDTTLCFDGLTNQWHERSYKNPVTNESEPHLGLTHFFFKKRAYVGDRRNGNIYEMNLDLYDDAGDEMQWKRISQHLQDNKRLLSLSSLELDVETGRGLVSGQGSDPQIMMRYSVDGGRNWSSELWESTGQIGDYGQRVEWRQLGRGRDVVFEFSGSDPVFYQINAGYLNAT